jgi:hypothetical protein
MAHLQIPDFVFQRNGQVHLNRRGRQFSWLLTAELRASAVMMLDTTCSEVVCRVLATQSIRQFPLHFPSRASPCAITCQLDSTSDCASTAIRYTATRRRSSSLGFTSKGAPRQEISGKIIWQKRPNPLASSFPEHNTTRLLHVGLRQDHCLPITSYRNWRNE